MCQVSTCSIKMEPVSEFIYMSCSEKQKSCIDTENALMDVHVLLQKTGQGLVVDDYGQGGEGLL